MGSPAKPAKEGEVVPAISYLRVSTEDQAREGFSLDAQRRRVRAYCEAKGYVLEHEFVDDGASGMHARRGSEERAL